MVALNHTAVIAETTGHSPDLNGAYPFNLKDSQLSPNDFLIQYPPGAYTACRTLGHNSIVEFDSHMTRIANSVKYYDFSEGSASEQAQELSAKFHLFKHVGSVRKILVPMMKGALLRYFELLGESKEEAKITLIVCAKDGHPFSAVHVTRLSGPKSGRCKVAVHGEPRNSPKIKDSQWVRDRQSIEDELPSDVNEALLYDSATGHVYEGLSSNFFAVVKDPQSGEPKVVTAPVEHVLLGTIMKIVIATCERNGIPVEFTFPNLGDLLSFRWEGAFITSTSRLVLPIETVEFPDGSSSVRLGDCPTVEFLRQEVEKEIYTRSHRIM
ncbi:D-aminoacid aminotransferase-like PLP-dependent enzyme [Basidiobolus meristosporus CBS 931.73]|uniref:D-aminoacid aminotransferase-like PLP-dependent enzyme n=1 Tax=Basidiobolus meristosporus CBS 931.73 TaxID=1314790 RepID=A0A1Y1XYA9_9FUNG|nr:D-aminoacid aminotransferase-like PLP-dependent enzyme [Basidiobolus meristosporus CBS 931.73]|eukprot:ORX90738.1 D-aminoacid aminotransferase-like PLP-dependent enzyme [Basidiobolus meristosporus CBS 931.73]